jgi:translation initiation factor 5B
MVAERLRLQQEEEERIKKEEEAELQRIADLEAAEEMERKRIEDEKEMKRKKKQEKIERQKREGTYMTKKEKQKAALAQQRLEAMKAAGMKIGSGNGEQRRRTKKPVYGSKKTQSGKGKGQEVSKSDEKVEDVEPVNGKKEEQEQADNKEEKEEETKEEEDVPVEAKTNIQEIETTPPIATDDDDDDDDKDEWDADSGDEWDADSDDDRFGDLEKKLEQLKVENDDEEEDLIEKEKQKEKERLRQVGLERQERDRIEAEKTAKFLKEQQALAHEEQMKSQKREEGKKKREEQEKANLAARTRDNLRCPISVIMGHVDTGKTKLLDKIRKTNVQGGEAGGITQQIGATYFEQKTLISQCAKINETEKFDITIPGMLVIDTPGHESFTNLRSRGSSLCDVAILVVDLMHGLEQQTIESLNMLRKRGTPFVVALNKIDRCYDWKVCPDTPIRDALKVQSEGVLSEFRSKAENAKLQLAEQGVNSNIYWEMGKDDWENSDFVPLVPTSAVSGEGVQDVLLLLSQMAQRKIWRQLMWHANLQCTVLEVKQIDGLGMTVDVLVVNGHLREGDRAVFCTLDGPVVAEIRGLLTPPPSREMRIKSEYIHHKEVKGALGVKIIGNNLEKVMAGTPVLTIQDGDEEEDIKAEVMSDLTGLQKKLSVDKLGVMVQASTLGALEALLQFLREETQPPIPVSAIGIGAIHKRDVTRISIMNEKGKSEFATILAFDVDVNAEARAHAVEMGVRIFTADIIYHLFDQFTRFMDNLREQRRQEAAA